MGSHPATKSCSSPASEAVSNVASTSQDWTWRDDCRAQACFGLKDSIVAGTSSKLLLLSGTTSLKSEFSFSRLHPGPLSSSLCSESSRYLHYGWIERRAGGAVSPLPFGSFLNPPCVSLCVVGQEVLSGIDSAGAIAHHSGLFGRAMSRSYPGLLCSCQPVLYC